MTENDDELQKQMFSVVVAIGKYVRDIYFYISFLGLGIGFILLAILITEIIGLYHFWN